MFLLRAPARLIIGLSAVLTRIERVVLMLLVAGIAAFVLVNVVFRMFGVTLAWADELAVLSMTLAAFVGAALMLRARTDPAVLILYELGRPGLVRGLRIVVSTIAAGFGVALVWMCWRWFNLPGLMAAGFDVGIFEMTTFNFLYTERTPILGLPSWRLFLVMPWFAVSVTVHALANLAEDLGLVRVATRARSAAAGEG
jgi:TRAP-type C4-dicarboxylate transport system permease small subunit